MASIETSLKLNDMFTSVLKNINSGIQDSVKNMDKFKDNLEKQSKSFDKLTQTSNNSMNDVNKTIDLGVEKVAQSVGKLNTVATTAKPLKELANNAKKEIDLTDSYIMMGANKIKAGMLSIKSGFDSLKNVGSNMLTPFKKMAEQASNGVDLMRSKVQSSMSKVAATVETGKQRILTNFSNFGNGISSKLHLDKVSSRFRTEFRAIQMLTSSMVNKVNSTVQPLKSKFSSVFNSISNNASKAFSKLKSVPGSAFNKVKSAASNMGGKLKSVFNSAKSDGNSFGDSMQSMGNKVSSTFKNLVAAIGVTKLIGAAFNTVKNSVGGAVDRFDTLNQFPKMMKAVGFSTNDAAAVKDKLIKGIDGLPTTLGDVVSTTQRIATLTRDLDGATDTTISLNNAFLASGSSSDDASRGLEQYVQMLSRGEVDMESWRSLQETMGTGLYDIADAFGFVGKSAQNDLYDALKSGTITFDQFNDKLVELYNTGTEGAKRALIGSEGIKTSFKNIKTAVVNGLEGIIRKGDEITEKLTGKSIAANLDGLKVVVKKAFASITDSMDKAIPYIQKMKGTLKPVVDFIKDIDWGKVWDSFKDSLTETANSIKKFMETISPLADFIKDKIGGVLKKLGGGDFEKGLGKLPITLLKLSLGFKVLSKVMKFLPNIKFPFFGKKKGGGNPVESLMDTFAGFTKNATNLALVFATIKVIEAAAEALKNVGDKIPDNLSSLVPKFAAMGAALAATGVVMAIAGKLAKKSPATAIGGILSIVGISGALILAALAMQQINDRVPDNVGNFAKKIANMAIAIGAMSLITGALGLIAGTGIGAGIMLAGLASVALIAGEMILVAFALQQFNDRVPEDIGSIKSKIDTMSQAIQAFTNANLGSVLDVFNNAIGVINTAVVIAGIDKMKELAQALNGFNEITVPVDASSKIKQIQDVLSSIDGASLVQLIESAITTVDLSVVKSSITKLIDLGQSLSKFDTIDFDKGSVKKKVQDIQEAIEYLGGDSGIFSKLKSLIGNAIDSSSFTQADQAFYQLASIGNSLMRLENIEFSSENVKQKVKDINSVIELLGTSNLVELVGTMIKSAQLNQVNEALNALNSLIPPINSIATTEVQVESAITKIGDISRLIQTLGGEGLISYFGSMIQVGQLGQAKGSIETMIEIIGAINQLAAADVQVDQAIAKINQINSVLASLNSMGEGGGGGSISSTVAALNQLVTSLGSVATASQTTATSVELIGTSFQQVTTIATSSMTAFNGAIQSGMSSAVASVNSGKAQIVLAFSGLHGQLQTAGYFAMSGLAVGIQSGSGSAIAAARSVANQVSSTIRSALDIHSPSRVMMAVGGFVTEGLANGILKAQSMVEKASNVIAQAAIPSDIASLDSSSNLSTDVSLDDSEISRLKASATQQIVVKHKQVVPQVTINVETNGEGQVDTEALLQEFEDKVMALMESDLG